MSSEAELILASLTAILGYRSCVHRRPGSHHGSIARSIRDPNEENTYGLPEGRPLFRELKKWFRRQYQAILAAIPKFGPLPIGLPNLTRREWVDPMTQAMTPILATYWDGEGKNVYARLGLDPQDWKVTNPHLRHQIETQSFNFCRSTNQATTDRLEDALNRLKHELLSGLADHGDPIPKLTERVNGIFTGLTKSHARTIARTEASRAHHLAQEQAAIESGVVAGKELLISSDACPLCQKIATEAKRVRLGQAFAVIGSNPAYAFVKTPPLHPNCQCTQIDILLPEYGGPTDVDWADTLDQPQEGLKDEYEPPIGKEVPKPEPDRAENKPKVVRKYQGRPARDIPTVEEIERDLGVKLAQSAGSKRRGDVTVVVSMAELDQELSKDIGYHVGVGGIGTSSKPGAYDRFKEFLFKAKLEGIPVELPRVAIDEKGDPFIDDGRHRWAVFRDMGVRFFPISVPRRDAKEFKERFGEGLG